MTPAEPIPSLLSDSLRPVAAPAELWDRVWQPRMKAEKPGLLHGFAFGLPVAVAAALICMVALTDPQHSPSGFQAAPVAKQDSSEIVTRLERSEAVLTVSSSVKHAVRAPGGNKIDAGCGLCHTL